MGGIKTLFKMYVRDLWGRDYVGQKDTDGKVILKLILKQMFIWGMDNLVKSRLEWPGIYKIKTFWLLKERERFNLLITNKFSTKIFRHKLLVVNF
jgi:hypothetical protein